MLSQLFNAPLSTSSRGCLVPLYFLPLMWCHLHLMLLMFLPAIFILACDSPSPAFHIMYSAYKLNKQDDHIQPCHTPFPILSQSIALSNCCFLIRIQVSKEAGKVVRYSHLFKNFPQFVVIHIVKGFSEVKEAEVDVILELTCFL